MFFVGDYVIALVKKKFGTYVLRKELRQPHGICYLHFGNGVCNGRHNGVEYRNGACTKRGGTVFFYVVKKVDGADLTYDFVASRLSAKSN